jgi:murein DD-endopeptidase MepM/ murein hydrolase activator NlpD
MIHEGKAANSAVLDAVSMPTSMGITVPNINPQLIAKTTLISQLSSDFTEALVQHGVVADGSMTLSEFEVLEATWPLTPEDVEIALRLYPKLDYDQVSTWSYGDYRAYRKQADLENLKSRFTGPQLRELRRRGIRIEDTLVLFKEFHNPDVILAQPDETLKAVIESSYNIKISMLGTESDVTTTSTPSAGYYTWVDFPRYGGDWFLNAVLTTEYWRNVQADRALRTQQVLYNSTSMTLYCTNMYGTYSVSQGGAHEGIDFAIGTTPPIYAAFRGTRITGMYTHHLAVYDVNSPDQPKTYSYLHMSQIIVTVGSTVNPYQCVGSQGNLGNATGYHVHFEVHAGNTNTLSSGSDHVLGSISPYRLQDYIGEL